MRIALAIALLAAGCAAGNATSNNVDGAGGTASSGSGDASTSGGADGPLTCEQGVACGNACVDLDSDPFHCGGCSRTCVVPQAEGSCSAGLCTLGACADGFADCDGDLNNGCEAEPSCDAGAACTTTCATGSEVDGVLDCTDPCAPSCDYDPNLCTLTEDCSEVCAGGAACRVGVHRASGSNGHFYSLTSNEATSLGFNIESSDYFHVYSVAALGLEAFYRCSKGGGQYFLTTAADCEGLGSVVATLGYISPVASNCNAVPLYRTRNNASGNHFYTTNAGERDNAVANLGYVSQGLAGYIWTGP